MVALFESVGKKIPPVSRLIPFGKILSKQITGVCTSWWIGRDKARNTKIHGIDRDHVLFPPRNCAFLVSSARKIVGRASRNEQSARNPFIYPVFRSEKPSAPMHAIRKSFQGGAGGGEVSVSLIATPSFRLISRFAIYNIKQLFFYRWKIDVSRINPVIISNFCYFNGEEISNWIRRTLLLKDSKGIKKGFFRVFELILIRRRFADTIFRGATRKRASIGNFTRGKNISTKIRITWIEENRVWERGTN